MVNKHTLRSYLSIRYLSEATGYSKNQISHWLRRREKNGLSGGVIEMNGHLLVNVHFFKIWVTHHKLKPSQMVKRNSPVNSSACEEIVSETCVVPPKSGFFSKLYSALFEKYKVSA